MKLSLFAIPLIACLSLVTSGCMAPYKTACPYESFCQCTDTGCDRPWDTGCISRGVCCEAFGNMGAR